MNITLAGAPGSGKTAIAHRLARLGWTEVHVGQEFRMKAGGMAEGIVGAQATPHAGRADREVDSFTRNIPASPTTRFVIDARLGFAFGQPCLSCLLKCDQDVAGMRVFKASRPDEQYESASDAAAALVRRRDLEIARFAQTYGVSYAEEDLFDIVIDTTHMPPEEAALQVRDAALGLEAECELGVIGPFRDEWYFLSNFYEVEGGIPYDGLTFSSSEAIYQSLKTTDPALREHISTLSPSESKHFAHSDGMEMRADWTEVRRMAMVTALFAKFANAELRERLLATRGHLLVEFNSWHDGLWGVCTCDECTSKPMPAINLLGKCLMHVRRELSHENSKL